MEPSTIIVYLGLFLFIIIGAAISSKRRKNVSKVGASIRSKNQMEHSKGGSSDGWMEYCSSQAKEEVILSTKKAKEKQYRDNIVNIIEQHIQKLAIKRNQNVQFDDYGNAITAKWEEDIGYFLKNVVAKKVNMGPSQTSFDMLTDIPTEMKYEVAFKLTDELVTAYQQKNNLTSSHKSKNIDNMSAIEFEHFCADILRKNSWKARVTQASGDQGVDIIANLGKIKAVLQCKMYSKPVGNKAVQEIRAGKDHEQADVAAVVSNNSYTPSAKQLAKTNGVYLLHYSELEQFAGTIKTVRTSGRPRNPTK